MWPIILVALGGALGAMLRYGLSTYVAYRWIHTFPLGTLIINVSGCFVVGYLIVKGFETGLLSTDLRMFLIIGVGGAFTTFSSFSFETVQLLREGFFLIALYNIFSNMVLCVMSTTLGVMLAKI